VQCILCTSCGLGVANFILSVAVCDAVCHSVLFVPIVVLTLPNVSLMLHCVVECDAAWVVACCSVFCVPVVALALPTLYVVLSME